MNRSSAARGTGRSAREPRWETFAHSADVGVRGFGASREGAFEAAALALTGVVTDPALVRPERRVNVACSAPDDELLLYGWLNGLITRMAVERMLFGRFEVSIASERLSGTAWGEPVDVERHAPCVEVKGATFTELAVRRLPDGEWVAQCIVDV